MSFMMKRVSKEQFINGIIWKLVETVMAVGTTFAVSIMLARLLDPEDFGIIALANVVINFSEIILQGAFSAPLIQKKDVDDIDYTSVLIFSIMCSVLLYIIVFLLAPTFADVYNEKDLTFVLRVISCIFVFQAIGSVRIAIISRNMRFKTLSICTIIASVISGAVGIVMAVCHYGVWALVFQKISYQALLNIILFAVIKWKPRIKGVSFKRVGELFSFGSKVLGSSVISYVSDSSINIVTGRAYSVSALGYSSKGIQYPCDLSIFSFQAVAASLFPTLSSYQNDVESQKKIMRKVVSVVAYVLFPMMLGMFAVSDRLIVFLLTDKWRASIPFMKIASIYYCATPIMLINVQLYHSRGNGKVRLLVEGVKLICTICCLWFGVLFFKSSLETIFICRTIIEIAVAFLSTIGLKKTIQYSLSEYFNDLKTPLVMSTIMAVVVVIIGKVNSFSNSLQLLIQILSGVILYILMSCIFKPKGYVELITIVKG